jgi:hypothetical protein
MVSPAYQEIQNLHGSYTANDGKQFRYYGKCAGFVPGRESFWEIRLFRHDVKFDHRGMLNSPDVLTQMSGPLVNVDMPHEAVVPLAQGGVEWRIEDWIARSAQTATLPGTGRP